jgi:hypothetical protein
MSIRRGTANMTEEQKEARRTYYREYRQKWRENNREREREVQRQAHARAYKRDPEKYRHRTASQRYGLTIPEYRALIARAAGHCEACGGEMTKPQIDHCHDTGTIRGVICGGCNSALGYARDDIDRLRSLIRYLERATRQHH